MSFKPRPKCPLTGELQQPSGELTKAQRKAERKRRNKMLKREAAGAAAEAAAEKHRAAFALRKASAASTGEGRGEATRSASVPTVPDAAEDVSTVTSGTADPTFPEYTPSRVEAPSRTED